jgi:NADPH-dependent 2,4-dienoyl-CoA reductase/sulfur reductase-like enzyme
MNTKPSFVIVGGGMAGAIAAQTLREEGFDGNITLLGQEPSVPYERPPLSKDYLQGRADRDSIFVQPEPWYAEHAVELSLGSAVTSLDPATGTVNHRHRRPTDVRQAAASHRFETASPRRAGRRSRRRVLPAQRRGQ